MVLLSALSLTLLASLVSSTPTPSPLELNVLPIRKSSAGVSARNLVDHGLGRIAHFNGRSASENTKRYGGGVVTNQVVSYVANIKVCGKLHKLVIDTGSANLWIGANEKLVGCPGSIETKNKVSVSYGSGSFSGTEWVGPASFDGLVVKDQSFAIAASYKGFTGVNGILGLGPVDLTEDTVDHVKTVPTFTNNLRSQHVISSEVVGISFSPEKGSDNDDANGELTFGGTDPKKYTGSISYFPKTKVSPFSKYWGISGISFVYGNQVLKTGSSAIVDTGTTLILIPSAAYTKLATLSKGTKDAASGLLSYTNKPTKNFALKINGKTFALTPSQYLVPQAQYSNFDLQAGKYYSWIGNGGTSNVNCLIGQKFLENYYSVFDTSKKRIGFASRKSM